MPRVLYVGTDVFRAEWMAQALDESLKDQDVEFVTDIDSAEGRVRQNNGQPIDLLLLEQDKVDVGSLLARMRSYKIPVAVFTDNGFRAEEYDYSAPVHVVRDLLNLGSAFRFMVTNYGSKE